MATVEQPVTTDSATAEKSTATVPIPDPLPTCKPAPRPPLTEAQQTKYDWLLSEAQGWDTLDAIKDHPATPIDDTDRQWLTRECLLRYLRATKWNEKGASKRLRDTLAWRRSYMPNLEPDHVCPEQETGKQLIMGYDNQGRPCHYLNPHLQNTDASPRQVHHLVFMLERVLDLLPAGQETLALLINQQTSAKRKNTAPGIGIGREVLNILQTHYPERLGKALVINVPWVVWGFYKLITPFIDPLTKQKLAFNEEMKTYIPSEQLWTANGGELEFEYNHEVYWPALLRLCEERRESRTKRWIAGGKHVGELEDYLAGALEKGVGALGAGEAEAKVEDTKPAEGNGVANGDAAVDGLKIAELKVDQTKAAVGEENKVLA